MNTELKSRVDAAVNIAALYADSVDKDGRFPSEAFLAIKAEHLLGVMVPSECGGEGVSLTDVAAICHKLGQACGSTGLIYAMHQIEVALLLAETDLFSTSFLRSVVLKQLLLASVTSEEGIGGSVRTSNCAIEGTSGKDTFTLFKKATTISYGAYADGLLITARKNITAQPGDQVLVTVTKDQYNLERTAVWDTLGMRGTCSDGFHVGVSAPLAQICPTPFSEIAESVMLPVSHILWSCVWLGIATDAYGKARAFLREQAKRSSSTASPGSNRLVNALGKVHMMNLRIKGALGRYEALDVAGHLPASSIGLTAEMNGLKVSISDLALEVVSEAMMITGIMGYKNNTPYSLGRHLRDIQSARLMVSNDRIVNNMSSFLMAQRSPVVVF